VTQLSPVTYGVYKYPDGAIVVGWMLGLVSLLPVPVCALIAILREQGSLINVRTGFTPCLDHKSVS
jgi:hypothetical protein